MPFARPTLTELRAQVASNIESRIPGIDALLRFSNLRILGEVLAGLAYGLFGYLDWIARQAVPFTATDEYLEGWAALKTVTRKPAIAATGTIALPALDGTVVPIGTPLARSDGAIYTTSAEAIAASGTVSLSFVAEVPGSTGNAEAGTLLSLSIGISGVTGSGRTLAAITGGADIEDDDALRSRMLAAYAEPPQGGSITDYEQWALAVPGVTRAWIKPQSMGPGTIVVFFMMDIANAVFGGFPQGTNGVAADEPRDTAASGDQLSVADALYLKQSATALVYAVAPIENSIDLTIAGLTSPSTALQDAIDAAIAQALRDNAVPGGKTNLSDIVEAIGAVANTEGFVVTAISAAAGIIVDGTVGNIQSDPGALPVLGAVTYA